MPQIFHPSMNVISRLSIVAVVLAVPLIGTGAYVFNQSYGINMGVPLEQPVQFSHKHHVTDDGLDCRYCHTSVETGAFAGVPSTEVCMSCHSQLWSDSPLLEPVRESQRTGTPIEWARVHDLPDFAYFNHSIHVKKGVGCVSCHGRVDQMPITWKVSNLTMGWCLDCHRNPQKHLRPRERVFDLAWKPDEDQEAMGRRLMQEYHLLDPLQMQSCSTCHN